MHYRKTHIKRQIKKVFNFQIRQFIYRIQAWNKLNKLYYPTTNEGTYKYFDRCGEIVSETSFDILRPSYACILSIWLLATKI